MCRGGRGGDGYLVGADVPDLGNQENISYKNDI